MWEISLLQPQPSRAYRAENFMSQMKMLKSMYSVNNRNAWRIKRKGTNLGKHSSRMKEPHCLNPLLCVCVCVCACASNSHSVTLSSFSDTSMFPLTYDQGNTEPRADEDAGGPKVPAANKCPSEKGRSK